MDINEVKKKVSDLLGKHKYALVILAVGLVLMLLPAGLGGNRTDEERATASEVQREDLAQELAQILSMIDGAGKVDVLLTVSNGESTVYQQDTDAGGGETGAFRNDTVIVRGENGIESGLVQQINPPKYQGAIVVCQGADRAAVRLAIVEAVSRATGLGADQISVLKMK